MENITITDIRMGKRKELLVGKKIKRTTNRNNAVKRKIDKKKVRVRTVRVTKQI